MISYYVSKAGAALVTGLSGDPKPSSQAGWVFIETDTGKNFYPSGAGAWTQAATGGVGDATWGMISGTLSNQTDLQTALNGKQASGSYATGTGSANGTNTGDQVSIVGISGTKAQFDTAVTDGNFLYVGDVTQYTDEQAQDAVGAMVDSTLVYNDGAPSLSRAGLTGAVTASSGSNATALGSFTLSQLNTALSDADVSTGGGTATGTNTGDNATNTQYSGLAASKQDTLISATNIKTVNGTTLLGSGNLAVAASDPVYAPGSFTVATETGRLFIDELILNGIEEATFQGTSTGLII